MNRRPREDVLERRTVMAETIPSGAPTEVHDADVKPPVWDTLRSCYDPEIPINIIDLGLLYRCVLEPLEEGDKLRVVIDMTLTAPGCGIGKAIADEVCDKLLLVPREGSVTVNMVFDPPWTRSMMSEAAQLTLGL